MGGMVETQFVNVVRTRLDEAMAAAGFPLNEGATGRSADLQVVSVLYEGLVPEFLRRYPGLDPVWDSEWREYTEGCVDLWIVLREDQTIDAHLEHWPLMELAEKFGDSELIAAAKAALVGPGELEKRVDVIGRVLELALEGAR